MAIDHAGKHTPTDEVCPLIGIYLGAREAERRLAAESNTSSFTAVSASVLSESHFLGIAAIEHFLYNFIVIAGAVKRGVGGSECVPVVTEYLFECVLVNVLLHSRLS